MHYVRANTKKLYTEVYKIRIFIVILLFSVGRKRMQGGEGRQAEWTKIERRGADRKGQWH